MLHSDRVRFGNKIRKESSAVVLGNDNYRTTIDQAYHILADTEKRLYNVRSSRRGTDTAMQGQSNLQQNHARIIPKGEISSWVLIDAYIQYNVIIVTRGDITRGNVHRHPAR